MRQDGNVYNINGDTAAAYIAGALKAENLIMMTDVAGILRNREDPSSLIPYVTVNQAKALYDEGIISGGMIPKVDCCIEAIGRGSKKSNYYRRTGASFNTYGIAYRRRCRNYGRRR